MLTEQIDEDMIRAMKGRQQLELSVLRMVKTALKLRQVETGKQVEDEQARGVLRTLVKQRRESAEAFLKGNRRELAEKELAEIEVIEKYLPAAASDAEMDEAVMQAIRETGAATAGDLGKAMKSAMARLSGKTIDGKVLSDKIRAKLAC